MTIRNVHAKTKNEMKRKLEGRGNKLGRKMERERLGDKNERKMKEEEERELVSDNRRKFK